MEIIFCDINKSFTDACFELAKKHQHLQNKFKFLIFEGDIRNLKVKNAAFVSPANSFGSMGGGIDAVYRQMFPKVDQVVMKKISELDTTIELTRNFDRLKKSTKRPYLPIGEAILTSLKEHPKYETCYLITAPTMVYPKRLVGDEINNPQKAFTACLNIVDGNDSIECLVCPGLGTGVGGISGEDCAKQMFDAINDFVN